MPNIHKTVACVIRNSKNEFLLIRSPKWKDSWVFAGGHVEEDETEVEAAVREAKEETGLATVPVSILGWADEISPPEFHIPINVHYAAVLLESTDDRVIPDRKEVTDFKWVGLDKVKDNNLAGYVHTILGWLDGAKDA